MLVSVPIRCLAFLCFSFAATSAAAQQVAEAEAAFARGEQQFAQNQFAAAEAEVRSAYDLMAGHPNQPMILVNIARSIEQQNAGRESEALALYEQALVDTEGNASAGDARRTAQERSTALRVSSSLCVSAAWVTRIARFDSSPP